MDSINSINLFHLLILANVFYNTIAEICLDVNNVVGKDKYFLGGDIKIISPIGFQQCQKMCSKRTDCLSTNYNKNQLTCELISSPINETQVESKTGFIYTVKVCIYILMNIIFITHLYCRCVCDLNFNEKFSLLYRLINLMQCTS